MQTPPPAPSSPTSVGASGFFKNNNNEAVLKAPGCWRLRCITRNNRTLKTPPSWKVTSRPPKPPRLEEKETHKRKKTSTHKSLKFYTLVLRVSDSFSPRGLGAHAITPPPHPLTTLRVRPQRRPLLPKTPEKNNKKTKKAQTKGRRFVKSQPLTSPLRSSLLR